MTAIHIPRLLVEIIVVIGFLGISIYLLSYEKRPNEIFPILGLFGMASLRLMPSLNRILTNAAELRRSAYYVDQVHDAFSTEAGHAKTALSGKTIDFQQKMELSDVSYTYPSGSVPAVSNINLTISRGQFVGFVGRSGSGKTTTMDILLGLLQPTIGTFLVDGNGPSENLGSWYDNIGFVPQDIFLIDDTLRRNIAFGIDDEKIDENSILKALKSAKLEEFVLSLPDGLDTIVGEHGARLSGGQKQRIVIARSLYNDPDILVFDEATSALDNLTEREISSTINNLAEDKTIVIVAHNMKSVIDCDIIVFLDNGRIVDSGTYSELYQRDKDFRKLAEADKVDLP